MNTQDVHDDVTEYVVPLLILRETIDKGCWLQPTAIMLPLSLLSGVEQIYGLTVVRGDRCALLYEAP